MTFFSSFTAEGVLRSCEVTAMIAGTVAVVALVGQILSARVVNARQAERILILEREANEARLKYLQLESVVTWRSLSKEQITKLESILSTKPSTLKFTYVANDPEALFFAIEISKSFTGWRLLSGSRTYSGTLVMGLIIVGKPESDEVNFVRDAFRAAGIPFSTEPVNANAIEFGGMMPGEAEPNVEIIVGSKPRPLP
jgi:hypothetical protein